MKIMTVEYRRLRTTSGYNNETVGAVAEVEYGDGEGPEGALTRLRSWVDAQFADTGEHQRLQQRVLEMRYEAEDLERRIERANRKWQAITTFLHERLGIDTPADIPDDLADLPF